MAGVSDDVEWRGQAVQDTRPLRSARGRRWPWPVAAGVLLAMSATVWLGANVVYYQPLQWGGQAVGATDSSVLVDLAPGGSASLIPVEPGEDLVLWFHLRNDGHRSVRIDDIGPTWFPMSYIEYVGPVMKDGSSEERRGGWSPGELPFEPFDLHPGEYAFIGSKYRFHECLEVDEELAPLAERPLGDPQLQSRTSWNGHEVITFSVGGYRRHVSPDMVPAPTIVWNRPADWDVDPNECPGFVELPNS